MSYWSLQPGMWTCWDLVPPVVYTHNYKPRARKTSQQIVPHQLSWRPYIIARLVICNQIFANSPSCSEGNHVWLIDWKLLNNDVSTTVVPNIVVKCLTLLLHIWEVPGSYLGPGDRLSRLRFFVVFLSLSTQTLGQYLKIRPFPLSSKSFQFIIHLSPYHLMLYSLSYWKSIIK
jgi:hypothetical protein